MAVEQSRRDFLGMAFGGVAAVGGVFALGAMKASWDPLPSVKAAGFTTIDLSAAEPNTLYVEKWRGKPIFILRKTAGGKPVEGMKESERDVVVGGEKFHMSIGLCTHLGCIPGYSPDKKEFLCACHGGVFDTAGDVVKAPPPSPLVIPPFKIDGSKLVIGEEGEEYKKMKDANLLA